MITKVFSVYDSKAQMFHVPFYMPTTPAAVRSFDDLVNDRNSPVNKHPGDYVLYQIGEFDDSTGELVSLKQHVNLGIGSQYIRSESPVSPALFAPKETVS